MGQHSRPPGVGKCIPSLCQYIIYGDLYETFTLTSKTSSGKDDHELNHLQGEEFVLPLMTGIDLADHSQEVWCTYPKLS